MCLLEFHPVLFFSSQNLQSSSSKASQSSSISFSSLSIESQLLQKIQNGYQRTSWGSFMNFVQMLVQILEFSIFPPWWRSWMDTRGRGLQILWWKEKNRMEFKLTQWRKSLNMDFSDQMKQLLFLFSLLNYCLF